MPDNKKKYWFIVAQEGRTVDGRVIKGEWLEQMAKNYDTKVYGARINVEHLKFRIFWKDELHSKSLGDVLALKTKKNKDGKIQLLAQIDPTQDLIDLNKDRQKIYTSVEINTNFAESGEAYLVGLAVTDSPASLGTEMLKFSNTNKSELNNFSQSETFKLTLDEKKENIMDENQNETEHLTEKVEKESFLERFRNMFKKEKNDMETAVLELAEMHNKESEKLTELEAKLTTLSAEKAELETKFNALQEEFNALRNTPEHAEHQENLTAQVSGATAKPLNDFIF